jgi:hypothetical protein
MTEAYPLAWPAGWPRTSMFEKQSSDRFRRGDWRDGGKKPPTFAQARDRLRDELSRLGCINEVISSNHPIDRYGVPRESKRRIADEGVAVYFTYLGKQMVMACDRFDDAAGNMTSLALAIEAMRQLDRHGGGQMMERAFAGFVALPSAGPPWYVVLGVRPDATADDIREAYRAKAMEKHPDKGGSHAAMAELNNARDEGMKLARERA